MKTVKAICGHVEGKRVDVHMMATNPVQYLEGLAECGVAMACARSRGAGISVAVFGGGETSGYGSRIGA